MAFLLLLVASPCATELAFGAVAAAFDATAGVTDACCHPSGPADADSDASDDRPAPGAQRSDCGCCHSFAPATFATRLASPVQLVSAAPPDTKAGEPRDGHREPPFRPPAHA